MIDPDNHWRHYAACRNLWELFDSVDVDGVDTYPHEAEAKAICAGCPVFEECRRDGLFGNFGKPEVTNIWAGEIMEGKR